MLRELKVFLDQLERDVLRAQGTEGNLTDKYQVSLVWRGTVHCFDLSPLDTCVFVCSEGIQELPCTV